MSFYFYLQTHGQFCLCNCFLLYNHSICCFVSLLRQKWLLSERVQSNPFYGKGNLQFLSKPNRMAIQGWERFPYSSCRVQYKGSGVEACWDKEILRQSWSMGQVAAQWREILGVPCGWVCDSCHLWTVDSRSGIMWFFFIYIFFQLFPRYCPTLKAVRERMWICKSNCFTTN